MEQLRAKKGFIIDMDGVIYHGNRLLPGVKEFVEWLYREQKNFLFLLHGFFQRTDRSGPVNIKMYDHIRQDCGSPKRQRR